MRKHKWSEQDYALLEKNVNKLGVSKGCEKTAKQLYVTDVAARAMYRYRLKKFRESGIKIDHPEIVRQAKVVEEKKPWSRWTEIEVEILKNNLVKHGHKKGSEITSVLTKRSLSTCKRKALELTRYGLDGYNKRVSLNDKEEELVKFFEKRIGENPYNLQAVFREGAELFGVSVTALHNRWYGATRSLQNKPTCRNKMKTVYTVIGKNATINGKNQNEPDVTETKNIFEKVVDWFKNKLNK